LKRILILTLILLLALPAPAFPQKRSSSTSKQKRKPAATAKQPPPDLRPIAAQVAEQLKLLTRFLYLYGKISTGLQTADEQAKRGESNQTLINQTSQSKASVVANIDNFRVGLEKLEETFHANQMLQRQYLKLLGASEAAATAKQLAAAGRFDEAGRVLLSVADRLADVLVEIR